MSNLHKGVSYDISNGTYTCQFYNKKSKRTIKKSGFKTPGEALVKYMEIEIGFHKENKGFLPKGIYVNSKGTGYVLMIRDKFSGTSATKPIYGNADLEEVKDARVKIIKGLIDI